MESIKAKNAEDAEEIMQNNTRNMQKNEGGAKASDKELIDAIRCCTSNPKIQRCKAECVFFCGGDLGHCIPKMGNAVADRFEALTNERRIRVNAERCVVCGEIIPEGQQICGRCGK